MRLARVASRYVFMVGWTIVMLVIRLGLWPIALMSEPAERSVRAWAVRTWGRGMLAGFGLRLHVEGDLPQPPCLFVTNHQNYLDIFILASQLGCVFISKAEVKKWPLIGWMASAANTIYIDRNDLRAIAGVQAKIAERIKAGYSVALFPESRIPDEGTMQDFKPALLDVAANHEWPVYYGAIAYYTPPNYPPASEWVVWRSQDTLFGNATRLLKTPGLEARLAIGGTPLYGTSRKELAQKLHQAVLERLEQAAARASRWDG